jgi:hypothetical protein
MIGHAELQAFIQNPEKYVNGRDLPDSLPMLRTPEQVKALFPMKLELRGFCPVTLREGKPGYNF